MNVIEQILWMQKARELFNDNDPEGARDIYKDVAEASGNANACHAKGLVEAQLGRWHTCISDLSYVIAVQPFKRSAHMDRGVGYMNLYYQEMGGWVQFHARYGPLPVNERLYQYMKSILGWKDIEDYKESDYLYNAIDDFTIAIHYGEHITDPDHYEPWKAYDHRSFCYYLLDQGYQAEADRRASLRVRDEYVR